MDGFEEMIEVEVRRATAEAGSKVGGDGQETWKPAATKAGATVEEGDRRRWQGGLRHDLDNNGLASGQVIRRMLPVVVR